MDESPRYRFPGMDPWLEHPAQWLTLHNWLIAFLAEDLTAKILPKYVASPGERVVVEREDGHEIYPDVAVYRRRRAPVGRTATEAIDPAVTISVADEERSETFVEVRLAGPSGRVVTIVEVLSPSNKRPGTDGFKKYRRKQEETMAAGVNLVEIDLLRGGEHVLSVPEGYLRPCGPYDYVVVVRRVNRPLSVDVYPIPLRQRLPRIPIPLRAPDPDAPADLQALVERVYRAGAYWARIDYRRGPLPALGADDAAWADELLRARAG